MKPTTIFYLVSVFAVFGVSAWAAISRPDETVVVTADPLALTADLDPAKRSFDSWTGQQIARDIDPSDRYFAFQAFARGLSGPLNQFYDWHGLRDDGFFIPARQFNEAGLLCRDFSERTEHHGGEGYDPQNPQIAADDRPPVVFGTACHQPDGWHFR
jgi:surface antigen